MGVIPIPKTLPVESLERKARIPYFNKPATAAPEKAQFFSNLSQIGLQFYDTLKQREAVDQFDKAQNETLSALNSYNQWVRENPMTPDTGLAHFNEIMKGSQENANKFLTNGAAQREFKSWVDERRTLWSDRAMEQAFNTDTALKRSNIIARHDQLLEQDMSGLTDEQLKEKLEEVEQNITGGFDKGTWRPDEIDEVQKMIKEGKEKLIFDFWESKLVGLPSGVFEKELLKSPLDTKDRMQVENKHAFYMNLADVKTKEQQFKEERDIEASMVNGKYDETLNAISKSTLSGDNQYKWRKRAEGEMELIKKRQQQQKYETTKLLGEISKSNLDKTVAGVGMAITSNNFDSAKDLIEKSGLTIEEKDRWKRRIESAQEGIRTAGEEIITDQQIRADLDSDVNLIWTGATKRDDFYRKLNKARYDDRTIDDQTYKELSVKANTELKDYTAGKLGDAFKKARQLIIYKPNDIEFEMEQTLMRSLGKETEAQQLLDMRQKQLINAIWVEDKLRELIRKNPDISDTDFDKQRDGFIFSAMKGLAGQKPTSAESEVEKTLTELEGTEVKPTAEELRKQNTREAYEKGKELGYWE